MIVALSALFAFGCDDDDDDVPALDARMDAVVDMAPGDVAPADGPLDVPPGEGLVIDGTVLEDAAVPTILGSSHPGWQGTSCSGSGCHSLPVANHPAGLESPDCASCHGGNGACTPNGPNSGKQDHTAAMDCTGCHPNQHGYTANTACTACHLAAEGTVDCM
jgi:hypothetical protein